MASVKIRYDPFGHNICGVRGADLTLDLVPPPTDLDFPTGENLKNKTTLLVVLLILHPSKRGA